MFMLFSKEENLLQPLLCSEFGFLLSKLLSNL